MNHKKILILLVAFLAGCSSSSAPISPSDTPLASQSSTPTISPTPTQTPTPLPVPSKDLWIAFLGSDAYFENTWLYIGSLYEGEYYPVAKMEYIPRSFQTMGESLAFSSGGQRLAFVNWSLAGHHISVLDMDTGEISLGPQLDDQDVVKQFLWHPIEQDKVLVQIENSNEPAPRNYFFDLNNSELVLINNDETMPRWRDNSLVITYFIGSDIWQQDLVTGNKDVVAYNPSSKISAYVEINGQDARLANWSGCIDYLPKLDVCVFFGQPLVLDEADVPDELNDKSYQYFLFNLSTAETSHLFSVPQHRYQRFTFHLSSHHDTLFSGPETGYLYDFDSHKATHVVPANIEWMELLDWNMNGDEYAAISEVTTGRPLFSVLRTNSDAVVAQYTIPDEYYLIYKQVNTAFPDGISVDVAFREANARPDIVSISDPPAISHRSDDQALDISSLKFVYADLARCDLFVQDLGQGTVTNIGDPQFCEYVLHSLSPDKNWMWYHTHDGMFLRRIDSELRIGLGKAVAPSLVWDKNSEFALFTADNRQSLFSLKTRDEVLSCNGTCLASQLADFNFDPYNPPRTLISPNGDWQAFGWSSRFGINSFGYFRHLYLLNHDSGDGLYTRLFGSNDLMPGICIMPGTLDPDIGCTRWFPYMDYLPDDIHVFTQISFNRLGWTKDNLLLMSLSYTYNLQRSGLELAYLLIDPQTLQAEFIMNGNSPFWGTRQLNLID